MTTPTTPTIVEAAELSRLLASLLHAWGMVHGEAELVADSLVDADLRGIDSHGTHLMQLYHSRIVAGAIQPVAAITVIDDTGPIVRLDAGLGLGQVAAVHAISLAVQRAQQFGMSTVTVRDITHVGALGYYTRRAATDGCIAIAFQNGNAFVPPFGGLDGMFSTNPFSYAVPGGEEGPVVFDIATTAVAGNKILVARTRGDAEIPAGWAHDDDGYPTTDPLKASIRQLQWFGGHKGYGLGLMVELMAGLLADSCYGRTENTSSGLAGWDRVAKGCTFIVLDAARFLPIDELRHRVDTLIRDVHACRPAPGFESALVPGEGEARTFAERSATGIPVPTALVPWL
jgi:LDH2 family malate/lactate/ureidoglycolate dehydrogenase